MAIDTREKRQSAVGISFYPMCGSVTPNAAQDQEWRQEAGYGYAGILVAEPVAPVEGGGGLPKRKYVVFPKITVPGEAKPKPIPQPKPKKAKPKAVPEPVLVPVVARIPEDILIRLYGVPFNLVKPLLFRDIMHSSSVQLITMEWPTLADLLERLGITEKIVISEPVFNAIEHSLSVREYHITVEKLSELDILTERDFKDILSEGFARHKRMDAYRRMLSI